MPICQYKHTISNDLENISPLDTTHSITAGPKYSNISQAQGERPQKIIENDRCPLK